MSLGPYIPHPFVFAPTEVTLTGQSYHQYAATDPRAVQHNFHQQHGHNVTVAAAIDDLYKKVEVLNWVAEHYPEILATREANKLWLARMEGGDHCETTEK